MSTDLSVKKPQSKNVTVVSQGSTAAISIGNALNSGKVGSSNIKCENQQNDIKQKREKDLETIAKQYSLSKKDLLNYIEKAFGYSNESFYNLDENTYNLLKNRTLPIILNFLKSIPNSNKKTSLQEKLVRNAERMNKMLQNGNTIEEATNFYENFKENGLFQILKIQFPSELKQYKLAKDVPSSVLESCITKFFNNYKQYENTNDNKNIGKSLTIFKNLLSRTSAEDYKILYNAFIKVASKEDEKLNGLLSMIDNFKENKAAFEKFVNEDLRQICIEKNLDYEKVKSVINKVAEVAKTNSIDSIEFMEKLLDIFDQDKIYNNFKQIDENKLDENQKDFIYKYETYKSIKSKIKDGETLNEEEKTFLKEFEQKQKSLKEGIVAAITAHNQDNADNILEIANKKYGISVENVIEKLIALGNEFDNVTIDSELLDKLTDGKYSKVLEEYEQKNNDKNVNEKTTETATGYGYKNDRTEDYNTAISNLPNLKAQCREEKECGFVVEANPKQKEPTSIVVAKSQMLKTIDNFNYALAQGLAKIDDAGKDFNNACKSVQLKVLSYLQRQKNNRLEKINEWHNSQLADVAANKFNFNREQIEDLKLSIGKKQVMINNYELRHKNDEEVA